MASGPQTEGAGNGAIIPKKLFREIPPLCLVKEVLQSCGLLGIHDLRWFAKEELIMSAIEEWIPILEPYYIPCKARRFLDNITPSRIITVLRHILRPHGFDFQTRERLYRNQKTTLYQIQPLRSLHDLSGTDLIVNFS